jgi:zinc finger RNA-binding protein
MLALVFKRDAMADDYNKSIKKEVNMEQNENEENSQEKSDDNQAYRSLKGVMRVGLLAKGLLLKGDNEVQLVVLCADKPTKTLFNRVYDSLVPKFEVKYKSFYLYYFDLKTNTSYT